MPKEVTDILSDPLNHNVTGGTGAVMLVVLLILEIVFYFINGLGCGAMILLEAYQRFFLKILMFSCPYGTFGKPARLQEIICLRIQRSPFGNMRYVRSWML